MVTTDSFAQPMSPTSPADALVGNQEILEMYLSAEERFNKMAHDLARKNGWNLGKAKRVLKAISRRNTKKIRKHIAKQIKSGQFMCQALPGVTEEHVRAAGEDSDVETTEDDRQV